jgi:hypothetical protein
MSTATRYGSAHDAGGKDFRAFAQVRGEVCPTIRSIGPGMAFPTILRVRQQAGVASAAGNSGDWRLDLVPGVAERSSARPGFGGLSLPIRCLVLFGKPAAADRPTSSFLPSANAGCRDRTDSRQHRRPAMWTDKTTRRFPYQGVGFAKLLENVGEREVDETYRLAVAAQGAQMRAIGIRSATRCGFSGEGFERGCRTTTPPRAPQRVHRKATASTAIARKRAGRVAGSITAMCPQARQLACSRPPYAVTSPIVRPVPMH